jgi:hypothetical protein
MRWWVFPPLSALSLLLCLSASFLLLSNPGEIHRRFDREHNTMRTGNVYDGQLSEVSHDLSTPAQFTLTGTPIRKTRLLFSYDLWPYVLLTMRSRLLHPLRPRADAALFSLGVAEDYRG